MFQPVFSNKKNRPLPSLKILLEVSAGCEKSCSKKQVKAGQSRFSPIRKIPLYRCNSSLSVGFRVSLADTRKGTLPQPLPYTCLKKQFCSLTVSPSLFIPCSIHTSFPLLQFTADITSAVPTFRYRANPHLFHMPMHTSEYPSENFILEKMHRSSLMQNT